jgi:hypothetical protein
MFEIVGTRLSAVTGAIDDIDERSIADGGPVIQPKSAKASICAFDSARISGGGTISVILPTLS